MLNFDTFTNFSIIFSLLGLIQGFFLAMIVYFYPNANRRSNLFLSLYLIGLSAFLLLPVLQKYIEPIIPKITCIIDPSIYLIGPFLFFYVRSFLKPVTMREVLPHLLPFVLYSIYLYLFLTYWFVPVETPRFIETITRPDFIILGLAKFVHLFYYAFLSFRALKCHQVNVLNNFSEISKVSLNWIRQLLYGHLMLVSTAMILYFIALYMPDAAVLFNYIVLLLCTPLIYIVSFKGLTQPAVLYAKGMTIEVNMPAESNQDTEQESNAAKYAKSSLSDDSAETIEQKLTTAMSKDKAYLESQLSIQDLAERIHAPLHHVSQVLNERLNKNFYDFVNEHRVAEARTQLLDPKKSHYTVLAIGLDAGFNSKTTFNTVFKKYTGMTPTEFRKNFKQLQR